VFVSLHVHVRRLRGNIIPSVGRDQNGKSIMFSYLFALQLGAVHLEYVDDYTTSVSFAAFKKFSSRRVFSALYSNNV